MANLMVPVARRRTAPRGPLPGEVMSQGGTDCVMATSQVPVARSIAATLARAAGHAGVPTLDGACAAAGALPREVGLPSEMPRGDALLLLRGAAHAAPCCAGGVGGGVRAAAAAASLLSLCAHLSSAGVELPGPSLPAGVCVPLGCPHCVCCLRASVRTSHISKSCTLFPVGKN